MNFAKIVLHLVDNELTPHTLITPEDDGYLGKIEPKTADSISGCKIGHSGIGMRIRMYVLIADEVKSNVTAFTVDNQKNVRRKKCLELPKHPEALAYEVGIQVKWSSIQKCLHTEYPFNNLRLLKIDGNVVEEWEISIVSQAGRFYLNRQKVYTWMLFRNETGEIVAFDESLATWPQMIHQLPILLGKDKIVALPVPSESDLRKFIRDTTAPDEKFENREGRVVWYNLAKGLGMIKTNKGLARVHWSKIKDPGKKLLVADQHVRFERLIRPKFTNNRSTSFQQEAIEVEKI